MTLSMLLVVAYVFATRPNELAGDQFEYDLQGRFFDIGQWWWTTTPFGDAHATAWKAPLYPAWVGFWYEVLGPSPLRVGLVQSLLAPVTVLLSWLLARRLFSPAVAIATAVVVAAFPLIWEYYGLLYSEALAVPLTVLAFVLFLGRRPTPGIVAALGVVMGLSLLLRPTSVFLLAGIAAAFVVAIGWRRGLVWTAGVVAVAALVVAPWTIRNAIVLDGFVPISVQDGAAYGTFNDESANDPLNPYAWRAVLQEPPEVLARGEPVPEPELRSELQDFAFDYIRDHPAAVPKAFFWNGLSRFWDVRRPARAMDEVDFQGRSSLVTGAGLAMYYVLLPLALWGLWQNRRRREIVWPVLAMAVAASVVFTVVATTRYRAPLEPLIVMLACAAVAGRYLDRDGSSSTKPQGTIPST